MTTTMAAPVTGYLCKTCGAASPIGIGYAGAPDRDQPDPDCIGPHALPDACLARAKRVRGDWHDHHDEQTVTTRPDAIVYRLGWDAHAAGEYPRPVLEDAASVARWQNQLSDTVWHHAAGATILGGYCCGTPASHRDALVNLARVLRANQMGVSQ
jgi:hypothetical protein